MLYITLCVLCETKKPRGYLSVNGKLVGRGVADAGKALKLAKPLPLGGRRRPKEENDTEAVELLLPLPPSAEDGKRGVCC